MTQESVLVRGKAIEAFEADVGSVGFNNRSIRRLVELVEKSSGRVKVRDPHSGNYFQVDGLAGEEVEAKVYTGGLEKVYRWRAGRG